MIRPMSASTVTVRTSSKTVPVLQVYSPLFVARVVLEQFTPHCEKCGEPVTSGMVEIRGMIFCASCLTSTSQHFSGVIKTALGYLDKCEREWPRVIPKLVWQDISE